MRKFKVGDIVMIREGVFYNVYNPVPTNDLSGLVGTVVGRDRGIDDYSVYVKLEDDRYNKSSHKSTPCCNRILRDDELQLARLPYTKITEKLHKNNIEKIEDGFIYLKG
jgi:hypothetical protein